MYRHLPPTMNSYNHKAQPQETVKTIFGEIEEIEDEVGREFRFFKNFEVVSSTPNDHHYLRDLEYIGFGLKSLESERYKERMKKERSLLAKDTPSSIFVRAYEFRDDLMRAAFIGPPGSDYQHSLFFFDIYFPITYPTVPPKLHYRSYGTGLNPNLNLRPDGTVRLNIQETWPWQNRLQQMCSLSNNNKGKWNPKESNVLYVLNAIHNLIAHPSPKPSPHSFYAVSGQQEEHIKKSCEQMTMVLRNPPVGFEFFVAGHFRQRAHPVLLKFKENNYDDRIMIELFIRMFTAFERNGAYCKHHLDFLKSRENYQISAEDLEVLKSTKHQITTEDVSFSKPKKRQISLCDILTKVDEEDSPQNQESGQSVVSYLSYLG